MRMTIYTANCRGNAKNSLYPNKRVIDNEDGCLEVMTFDHVCAEFKSYRRSNDNFLSSDVEVMDCDNDHSDNPADWIHPEKLSERIGQDVAFAVVPSRNHMKPREGKSARPRFHVYFPHDPITDGEACAALKKRYTGSSHFSMERRWTLPVLSLAILRRRFCGMRARSRLTVS